MAPKTEKYRKYYRKYSNNFAVDYLTEILTPVAEFSVSVCTRPKFLCTSDDSVPRLLIIENDASYKSNIYKKRMM